MIDLARLSAPFPPDRVSWRVGPTKNDKTAGIALAYIDARDVMERLDEVCGPGGWQDRYPHAGAKTVCEIGIKLGDEWVWKSDGAGDTDTEAEKGALSSAFKRCAVKWGIGRYLYDVDSPWVEIEQRGRSYVIKQSEHDKLRRLLAKAAPSAPRQATPRPIPAEVARSPDAPSDIDRKMADSLIGAGRQAQTNEELNLWWKMDATQAVFRDLPDVEQDRVTNELAKHRHSIKARAA